MKVHRRDFVKIGAAAACAAAWPRSLSAAGECANVTVMMHGLCSFVRHNHFGHVACLGKLNTPEAGALHLGHEPWLRIFRANAINATPADAALKFGPLDFTPVRGQTADLRWYECNISGWSLQLLPGYQRPGLPICNRWMLAGHEMFFPKATLKKKDKWAIAKHQAAIFRLGHGEIYPLSPTDNFAGAYTFEPKGGVSASILKKCQDRTGLPPQFPRPITDRAGYRSLVPSSGLRIRFSKLTSRPWEPAQTFDLNLQPVEGDVVLQVVYRKVHPQVLGPKAEDPLDHFALHYGYVDPGVDEALRPVPRRFLEASQPALVKPAPSDYTAEIGSKLFEQRDLVILVDDTTGCPGYTGPPDPPG
jgi:hypothetical protein